MGAASPDAIYLNAAGHGLPDARVRERMAAYLRREEEAGAVVAASEVAEELAAVRDKAAALIGAPADEVAFSTTTTLAWGIPVAALPLKGRRILVAPNEWVSNIVALQRLPATRDMELQTLAMTPEGDVDMQALRATLDDDVAAICVPMVSSLTGRRYPVEEIGALPRPDTSFYIVDAAQALGQMPVDVQAIGCDMCAATARKWLRSPRGNALLHVSQRTLERANPAPFPDSGTIVWRPDTNDFADAATAVRFEGFDFNVPLRLALGAALDVAAETTIPKVGKTIAVLTAHVRQRIAQAGLALFSPGEAQSGITTFRLPAGVAQEADRRLAAAGITVKLPGFWNEPLLDPAPEGDAILRVSPHVYNTREEIDALFDTVAACL